MRIFGFGGKLQVVWMTGFGDIYRYWEWRRNRGLDHGTFYIMLMSLGLIVRTEESHVMIFKGV